MWVGNPLPWSNFVSTNWPATSCRADVAEAKPFFWIPFYTNAGIRNRQKGDHRMTEIRQGEKRDHSPDQDPHERPASRFSTGLSAFGVSITRSVEEIFDLIDSFAGIVVANLNQISCVL